MVIGRIRLESNERRAPGPPGCPQSKQPEVRKKTERPGRVTARGRIRRGPRLWARAAISLLVPRLKRRAIFPLVVVPRPVPPVVVLIA